jgi:hypothetical protein
MKTIVGIVLAVVLGAGVGVLGSVVLVNGAVASVDKAASSAKTADLGAPSGYKGH